MTTANMTLVGRLARDPDVRTSHKGTTVCTLTVPVDTGWGDNKTTTWWRVSLFGKRGESAGQYLRKGSWVSVSGPASVREYDKKDGTKGWSAEVTANDWSFVGPKEGGGADDRDGGQTAYQKLRDHNDRNRNDRNRKEGPSAGYSDADLPF